MKQLTPMQELRWFVSDGLDNYDESIKVSEIRNKINELIPKEQQVIEENKKMKSLLFDVVEQASETIKVNSMGASETYYQLIGQIEQLLQH